MVRRRALSRLGRPLAGVGLCLVATSAALGWGKEVPPPKGEDYLYLNQTEASDLFGRWRIVSVRFPGGADRTENKAVSFVDIVPCGPRYCGIAVGADGACGAVVLTFEDRGPTFAKTGPEEWFERFAGSLDWHAKYVVYLDVHQGEDQKMRPLKNAGTSLFLSGSSDGVLGRAVPLEIAAVYSAAAVCKAPTS